MSVCFHLLYTDVAISAPFGEGQPGTVFIYVGSLQGIVRTPAQTIVGSQLNLMSGILANLTSFGASLSGTTDIDGNGYNGECTNLCLCGSRTSCRHYYVHYTIHSVPDVIHCTPH